MLRPVTPSLSVPQSTIVREFLMRANTCLAVQLKHTYNLARAELVESARDAVFDAWRHTDSYGGPLLVLAALDEFEFGRLDMEAAQCVDQARAICREVLSANAPKVATP
jgi:hypothetical protein